MAAKEVQKVEGAQRREVATCGHSLSVVKCYYKCGDLYERPRCGPFLGRGTRRRPLSARILGNDFTFTHWQHSENADGRRKLKREVQRTEERKISKRELLAAKGGRTDSEIGSEKKKKKKKERKKETDVGWG